MLGQEPALALPREGALIATGPTTRRGQSTGSHWLPVALSGAALALAVSGCSGVSTESLQQDVQQLRQDLNGLTLAVHRGRGDSEAVLAQLDRRTREQSTEQGRQIAALSARVDSLNGELARTTARVEELSQRLDTLARRLESRGAEGGTPNPAAPATPTAPTPRAGAEGPTVEQAYQAAYLDFSKGNYPLAVAGFRELLRRYPTAPQADQAQYWIGESYFSMGRASAEAGATDRAAREYEQAVQEFRRLALYYPRGEKVATGIYKEALALLELKQTRQAQLRLQYLLDNFPQSEEAPLARERLTAIGS